MMTQTTFKPNFTITILNRSALIQLPKHLDRAFIATLNQQLQSVLATTNSLQSLVFDFANVTFIDSPAIGGIREIITLAKSQAINLKFWSLSPAIETAMTATGIIDPEICQSETKGIPVQDTVKKTPVTHQSVNSPLKRMVDIAGALVGLSILGVLYCPLAIAIKLDSPGPVFFSQTRHGLRGEKFRVWKFRSMVSNAEQLKHQVENEIEGAFFKNKNDPRITRVGAFLRRSSLDEFPQFWNVLKGEMSLVGTRPPTVDEVEQYQVDHWRRLDVKPGITGEWQVNGRSEILDFEDVVRLDLHYQEKWSIWHDFKLILQTVGRVVSKNSGAC